MADADKGRIPVLSRTDAPYVLGTLFEKHWKIFYETHMAQFEEFIASQVLNLRKDALATKLKDPQLAKWTENELKKLGVDKTTLAKQWCAAQLCFYLFRYGGALGVHYPTVEQEEKLEVVSGQKLTRQELPSRFGKLFRDVLSGRVFKTDESLANFSTFGDCDEISFAIAQAIEAINKHSKLGLEAVIFPSGVHALVGVKFSGLDKQFLMDPTFVGEEDRFPRRRILTISLGAIIGPGITTEQSDRAMEDYANKVVPRLNKRIAPEAHRTRVLPSTFTVLDNAFMFASNQPHEVLTILRHLNRCLWNEHVRDDDHEKAKLVKHLEKVRPEHGNMAIDLAVSYVSTFFEDFKRAREGLTDVFTKNNLSQREKIDLLMIVGRGIAQGKQNVDKEIEAFLSNRTQRVAMR